MSLPCFGDLGDFGDFGDIFRYCLNMPFCADKEFSLLSSSTVIILICANFAPEEFTLFCYFRFFLRSFSCWTRCCFSIKSLSLTALSLTILLVLLANRFSPWGRFWFSFCTVCTFIGTCPTCSFSMLASDFSLSKLRCILFTLI